LSKDKEDFPLHTRHDPYSALRVSEFRNFILARFFLTIASLMQAVIVGWQVYELTKDPLSLGLVGLAEVIPSIAVSFFAGHIVDTSIRKHVLLFAYSLLLFCSVSLFFISTDTISFITSNKITAIYAAIFISGIARGFSMPSAFAFWSQLIPQKIFANAVTWNTSTWQLGAVTGPAIAGFVYALLGYSMTYLVVAIIIFSAIVLISFIKKRPKPEIIEQASLLKKLTAGAKFVYHNKIILNAITLDLFAVLFGGATALLPIFSADILFVGPEGLGMLRAAPSVGALLMAVFLTRHPPTRHAGRVLLMCVFGFGVSMIVFAVSKNFSLSLFALAIGGAFDAVSVVIRSTIIQLMTPDNMKGRVSAVNSIFVGSSNEIGAFESGVTAKFMGTVPSVIFGGSMTLVVVFIVWYFSPKLRKLSL
jgi:MFS family permease